MRLHFEQIPQHFPSRYPRHASTHGTLVNASFDTRYATYPIHETRRDTLYTGHVLYPEDFNNMYTLDTQEYPTLGIFEINEYMPPSDILPRVRCIVPRKET